MLPLETGRGLYSGMSGMGGGAGKTGSCEAGIVAGPCDFGLMGESFFGGCGLIFEGTAATLGIEGRAFLLSCGTKRGPSFVFGLNK